MAGRSRHPDLGDPFNSPLVAENSCFDQAARRRLRVRTVRSDNQNHTYGRAERSGWGRAQVLPGGALAILAGFRAPDRPRALRARQAAAAGAGCRGALACGGSARNRLEEFQIRADPSCCRRGPGARRHTAQPRKADQGAGC
jgi:hypothetical protein